MKRFKVHIKQAFIWVPVFFLLSCKTFYQANLEFNKSFEFGQLEAADKILDKNKKEAEKKARFLYYVNKGVVASMLGKYEESNVWFEKAYIFGEDLGKQAGNVALSFLTNPNAIVYPGEDHEHLLLLYYKALNYLKLGDNQAALVECRRLNNRLNELSDKYRSDNKYREDAFIHNLMGIIYQADGDFNNAFIAYRNAYTIYTEVYVPMFGVYPPEQLKRDLIRAADMNGFATEADFYRREFGLEAYRPQKSSAELVFFWHNGLGPVKDEWSVNFTTGGYSNGFYTFTDQTGQVHMVACSQAQANQLSSLSFIRIAFPTYVERPPRYFQGRLHIDGDVYDLELAENIDLIAKKTLQERMAAEIGKGLLRFALKKVVEEQARKQDEGLGMLVSLFNAATEKADTRNWQTIPHSIFYTRVPLQEGTNTVTLTTGGNYDSKQETFTFEGKKGEIVFHTYQTLESFVQ
jgi:hypothetical protein